MIIIQHYKHVKTLGSIPSSIARNKIWNNRQMIWYFWLGIGFPLRSALKISHSLPAELQAICQPNRSVGGVFCFWRNSNVTHNLSDCPSQLHITQYHHITIDRLQSNSVSLSMEFSIYRRDGNYSLPNYASHMQVDWSKSLDKKLCTQYSNHVDSCLPGRTTLLSLSCSIVTQ